MERVGHFLTDRASRVKNDDEIDAFARSAFNRYYYACYLMARKLVLEMFPNQGRITHKGYPEFLRGKALKKIKKQADSHRKSALLTPGQRGKLVNAAANNLVDLADLLEEGYRARVTADYEPEKTVVYADGKLVLEGKSLSTARGWPKRADNHRGAVLNVWKQLGN